MFRIIHPNRWFFWTVSTLMVVGLFLLYNIQSSINLFEKQAADLISGSLPTWKTFRSEDLGIAVKYPSAWQIEVDPLEPHTFYLENPQNFNENISFSVVKPFLEKTIRESIKIRSEQKITVDSIEAKWLMGDEAKDKATSNIILVKKGEKLYYIAGSARDFERIIKGIRFIN